MSILHEFSHYFTRFVAAAANFGNWGGGSPGQSPDCGQTGEVIIRPPLTSRINGWVAPIVDCSWIVRPDCRAGFVYDLRLKNLAGNDKTFFPAEAYYTLWTIPK